jgi:hypothetical protein
MTAWTTPRTWVADEVPDESTFNTHVRDNLNYLKEHAPDGLAGSPDIAGVGGAGTSEEWGTSTTGLTWSPSSPTTVDSNTTLLNHLYIANQADTTERLGTKAWVPGSGAFDARLGRIMVGCNTTASALSAESGLHIGDATNANRLLCTVSYAYNTGEITIRAYTYAASTYTQRGTGFTIETPSAVYLRITRDGSNNCSFYYSFNGVIWQIMGTQSFTLTVANIGLRVAANATAGHQAAFDWLRTSV